MSVPVMLSAALAAGLGFTLLAGRPLIPWLAQRAYRQRAYEDAPKTHQTKTGTPTMGGVLFLAVAVLTGFVVHDAQGRALILLLTGCGAIGALDDYMSIRHGKNRGLRARTKFLATLIVALLFLFLLEFDRDFAARDVVFRLGTTVYVWPHWCWYALSLCVILATTHAVNLTDGLDGLATGSVIPPVLFFMYLGWKTNAFGVAMVAAALAGACLGFLYYNRHPARVFMGDTGSLALGGLLAGCAILTGTALLLPLVGGVFVAEALSVIIQVASYKATKRRVFRMSPLHHHFELGGWPETKVTLRFWTASALLTLAGLTIVR